MNGYCLGTGFMEKCRTCQHDANWHTLNQMPDALRRAIQRESHRVDESLCQITSGRFYQPIAGARPDTIGG